MQLNETCTRTTNNKHVYANVERVLGCPCDRSAVQLLILCIFIFLYKLSQTKARTRTRNTIIVKVTTQPESVNSGERGSRGKHGINNKTRLIKMVKSKESRTCRNRGELCRTGNAPHDFYGIYYYYSLHYKLNGSR